ncbi:MAG: hypothetical protein LBE06_07540 [Azoarcus sp.]|jgi:hypothetical protein|nr:hypothetical protein [Azoarcus sp.]
MKEELRYSIVFDGQTLTGIPEKTVKSNLATLCAEEGLRPDDLFSGDTFTLRRDLSREDADRIAHDLLLAGAVVRKERYAAREQPILQFPDLIFTEEVAPDGLAAADPPGFWGAAGSALPDQKAPPSHLQSLFQADTVPRVVRDILEDSGSEPGELKIVEEEPAVFDEAAATASNWDSPNGFWKNSPAGASAWGESDR